MSRFTRLEVLTSMLRVGAIPIFHQSDPRQATGVVDALAAGGAEVIEFTNRGDAAHEVFGELERTARAASSPVMLGAGSVVDGGTAALYINLGAAFIVSPSFSDEVARVCNRRRVAYLPGCATATEVAVAETAGCEIVKVFPGASVGGPNFVAALLGPSPSSRLMPTGGVAPTRESLEAWFLAGAACVGLGSQLIPPREVADGDWDAITERMAETRRITHMVRPASEENWA